MSGRVLIAGIGNIFLGDDAFGVDVVRPLLDQPMPDRVDVVDYGIRGVHLAYDLLDGRYGAWVQTLPQWLRLVNESAPVPLMLPNESAPVPLMLPGADPEPDRT